MHAATVEGTNGFEPDHVISWSKVAVEWEEGGPSRPILTTRLSESMILNSPSINSSPPVVHRLDRRLAERYGWFYELTGRTLLPKYLAEPGVLEGLEYPSTRTGGGRGNLRSVREVLGYDVHAPDGSVGHIEDLDFVAETGVITAVIIDTRNYWPGGRKVSLHPSDLEEFDVVERACRTTLPVDWVKSAPPVDRGERAWIMEEVTG